MSFIWPTMLVLLLLIPIGVFLYIRLQKSRRKISASYGSLGMSQGTARAKLGARRHIPPSLFFTGLTILVIALARPQAVVRLPRVEGTVILAFDASGSMAADDMNPTRMEAAKAAARTFIERQPSTVKIGVVSFSDSGFSVQPPTNDQNAVLAAINRLSPQRGTSLGRGIQAAIQVIDRDHAGSQEGTQGNSDLLPEPVVTPTAVPKGTYAPAVIVMLTDGENNQTPDPLIAANDAVNRGIRIYTVGIGSPGGATLQIEGFSVHTQLDEPLLQQIAQVTGGTYFNAENQQQLNEIYSTLNPELLLKPEKMEVTSIFAGASIFVMLVGGMFSMFWFSRLP
jgi:Ca-activated chloride channel homolog